MKFAVGSQNPSKVACAQLIGNRLFDSVDVIGVSVSSSVADQPSCDEECIEGAINRARRALERVEDADYGIGMEGGFHRIGDRVFESGWIVVVDRNGKIGIGSSARMELSRRVFARMQEGLELGAVTDELTGRKGVAQQEGYMGLITLGHVPRVEAYSHGLLFAFAPFISDPMFWE